MRADRGDVSGPGMGAAGAGHGPDPRGPRHGRGRPGGQERGHVDGRAELQPHGADEEGGLAHARHHGRVRTLEASQLLWFLLLGAGHAAGPGQRVLLRGVCLCPVEVFQQ